LSQGGVHPITPRGREGNKKKLLSFSLLSLWERRVGEVRARRRGDGSV